MRLHIITLFPESFDSYLRSSIIGRAKTNGFLEVNIINLCDFSVKNTRRVDDRPFGWFPGTIIAPEPLHNAILNIEKIEGRVIPKIVFSPRWKTLRQAQLERFAKNEETYILVCGHYEGIDERVIQYHKMQMVSLGDYVLTSGELAALVWIDGVTRLIPGVIEERSLLEESFSPKLKRKKEYPQYTRPQIFLGQEVPSELISGDPKKIEHWKNTFL